MNTIKMVQRSVAAVLVLLLVLSVVPASVFAAEAEEPTVPETEPGDVLPEESAAAIEATEPEESATDPPEETEVPEESIEPTEEAVLLLATGKTVKITTDRTRQIQWIGHSDARLTISYKDAQGTSHSGWMTAINKYTVDGVYAYCIEPAVELGDSYTEDEAAKAWATQLTKNQRTAIAAALAYGYPAQEFPAANPPGVAGDSSLEYPLRTDLWQVSEKYAATQIIVWEIVMGKRSATPPYTCTDKSLFESFYRTSNPYGYRADWNTLKQTYDTISANMASVGSVPSFAETNSNNAPVYDLTYDSRTGNYTKTLTDSNGALSGYNFTCSVKGVTISKSGNKLTITATPEAASKLDGTVLCSAKGSTISVDPDTVIAVWSPNGAGQTAVSLKADPEPVTVYFKLRAEVNGDLEIIKTSSSGNVSGFQFRVQGNGIDKTVTSDSTGKIKVENLQEGTYTVTELLPNDSGWYCTSTNPQTVKVEAGKTSSVSFNNEKKQWRVTVYKEDRETGGAQADATLDGAVYGLYKDGVLVKEYTVKNGTFTTDAYDCGTGYTLKEISAPPGYQLDTIVYNLNDYSTPGKCSGPLSTSQVTVLEDVITGLIEIIKRTLNSVSNETAPESGAVFRYYLKSAGSYDACPSDQKGTMTTGTDGKARSKELPYGTYVVEQVSGAEGTDLVDSFEVMVSEHGQVYTYTKDNPYWTGAVSIVKVEEGTTTPLVATFVLLDENKAVLETVTTGDDGKASFSTRLVYGKTYYVQETVAPEGYVLDETQHPITVTERDQEIAKTQENIPEEGSISVKKVDTRGTPMEGVKFRLDYSTDGQNWKPVTKRDVGSKVTLGGCTSAGLSDGCLTTDASGLIVFTGLRISTQNQKVYYRLIECSTENGASILVESAYEGELPMDGNKDITVTAVNSQVFELPHTGRLGMITVPFGVMMLSIAGWTVFCFAPRKQKKED